MYRYRPFKGIGYFQVSIIYRHRSFIVYIYRSFNRYRPFKGIGYFQLSIIYRHRSFIIYRYRPFKGISTIERYRSFKGIGYFQVSAIYRYRSFRGIHHFNGVDHVRGRYGRDLRHNISPRREDPSALVIQKGKTTVVLLYDNTQRQTKKKEKNTKAQGRVWQSTYYKSGIHQKPSSLLSLYLRLGCPLQLL